MLLNGMVQSKDLLHNLVYSLTSFSLMLSHSVLVLLGFDIDLNNWWVELLACAVVATTLTGVIELVKWCARQYQRWGLIDYDPLAVENYVEWARPVMTDLEGPYIDHVEPSGRRVRIRPAGEHRHMFPHRTADFVEVDFRNETALLESPFTYSRLPAYSLLIVKNGKPLGVMNRVKLNGRDSFTLPFHVWKHTCAETVVVNSADKAVKFKTLTDGMLRYVSSEEDFDIVVWDVRPNLASVLGVKIAKPFVPEKGASIMACGPLIWCNKHADGDNQNGGTYSTAYANGMIDIRMEFPHVYYSSSTMPSWSGCPVYNHHGHIIAIHQAGGPAHGGLNRGIGVNLLERLLIGDDYFKQEISSSTAYSEYQESFDEDEIDDYYDAYDEYGDDYHKGGKGQWGSKRNPSKKIIRDEDPHDEHRDRRDIPAEFAENYDFSHTGGNVVKYSSLKYYIGQLNKVAKKAAELTHVSGFMDDFSELYLFAENPGKYLRLNDNPQVYLMLKDQAHRLNNRYTTLVNKQRAGGKSSTLKRHNLDAISEDVEELISGNWKHEAGDEEVEPIRVEPMTESEIFQAAMKQVSEAVLIINALKDENDQLREENKAMGKQIRTDNLVPELQAMITRLSSDLGESQRSNEYLRARHIQVGKEMLEHDMHMEVLQEEAEIQRQTVQDQLDGAVLRISELEREIRLGTTWNVESDAQQEIEKSEQLDRDLDDFEAEKKQFTEQVEEFEAQKDYLLHECKVSEEQADTNQQKYEKVRLKIKEVVSWMRDRFPKWRRESASENDEDIDFQRELSAMQEDEESEAAERQRKWDEELVKAKIERDKAKAEAAKWQRLNQENNDKLKEEVRKFNVLQKDIKQIHEERAKLESEMVTIRLQLKDKHKANQKLLLKTTELKELSAHQATKIQEVKGARVDSSGLTVKERRALKKKQKAAKIAMLEAIEENDITSMGLENGNPEFKAETANVILQPSPKARDSVKPATPGPLQSETHHLFKVCKNWEDICQKWIPRGSEEIYQGFNMLGLVGKLVECAKVQKRQLPDLTKWSPVSVTTLGRMLAQMKNLHHYAIKCKGDKTPWTNILVMNYALMNDQLISLLTDKISEIEFVSSTTELLLKCDKSLLGI
jgi:hypothetical protein